MTAHLPLSLEQVPIEHQLSHVRRVDEGGVLARSWVGQALVCELATSRSDHQDDDVTPLIIGSEVVLSLWRGVLLTVSLLVAEIASSAWFVSICEMVMTITCCLACSLL